MEFLKTCSTNAQAIVCFCPTIPSKRQANTTQGDYEAVAYQAFSITRDNDHVSHRPRDWSSSDELRAAEAGLRRDRHFVTQDASRPWLWHFEPIALDAVGHDTVKLPSLEGYYFHRTSSHLSASRRPNTVQVNSPVA